MCGCRKLMYSMTGYYHARDTRICQVSEVAMRLFLTPLQRCEGDTKSVLLWHDEGGEASLIMVREGEFELINIMASRGIMSVIAMCLHNYNKQVTRYDQMSE
ncbi:hypothetical protein HBH56_210010 [Parastagonospora nodorum]|uniref:Uncharacterized protein n=1 Tax=Phaeosphaeria nodorum (strain SN15 / ATCC MYA-4574 / FGSC 10173) TaxID=321614 RepID=A0A7U2I9U9_PHANO|nr:hypothetical protein HBH56_210010 [Parastagonospora nodorum]QRD05907.1 hypothetical protein JI435_133380 [Parastagonospora nodorum SN15]KAH3931682.1 hypothetical protein HBH54_098620 [Parastagonospora nodorum]KAH3960774.1 hypothetical protein HBH51_188370 [Parastagonospora nodorum]KAH3962796.1 hypothetical protein HBH52_221040 [Parastagonospora nodorum]